ncbi:MAG TPA: hypothetical protein VLZ77_13630 [Acidimicrobiales bacterium]|nr:hypothetical protein [Acidimicrobiales bacterium]
MKLNATAKVGKKQIQAAVLKPAMANTTVGSTEMSIHTENQMCISLARHCIQAARAPTAGMNVDKVDCSHAFCQFEIGFRICFNKPVIV